MSVAEALRRADYLNALIDADVEGLHEHDIAWVDAEQEYRHAVTDAWERCPRDEAAVRQNGDWPVKRREAWVAGQTADLRHARDSALSARETLRASLESRRQQLSALQTLVNAEKSELEREERERQYAAAQKPSPR